MERLLLCCQLEMWYVGAIPCWAATAEVPLGCTLCVFLFKTSALVGINIVATDAGVATDATKLGKP